MDHILFEDHDHEESHRSVLISGGFAHEINALVAKMYSRRCELTRLQENAAPLSFRFSEKEMDTLVEQWQAFKVARAAYLDAEKQQEQAGFEEAMRLAKVYGFSVRESNGYYRVCWADGVPFTAGYVHKGMVLDTVRQMVNIVVVDATETEIEPTPEEIAAGESFPRGEE